MDGDRCVLFGEDFFIRGCIEIPILDYHEPFIWGSWVSFSKQNFERESNSVTAGDSSFRSYVGWLSSRIQVYPDTLLLKVRAHMRPNMRPYLELEPTDHPLVVDQRNGITMDRVRQIGEQMEHHWRHPDWDKKGLWGGIKE